MFGGAGNDELYGWDSRIRALGGPGDDDLIAGERNDRLFGGNGRDILTGQEGDDTIRGGRGKDVLDYSLDHFFQGVQSHRRGVRVDLTTGVATGKAWGTDRISGIDKVWTGDGSDTVIGNDRRNVFYTGFGRRNEIDGGGGRDRVTFRSDVIDGLCCSAVRLDLAAGSGLVENPAGGFTEIRIRDVEDVVGSLSSDLLLGDDGPNRLIGADEFGRGDRLVGRGGNDRLVGGEGNDRLNGGIGDNVNEGGPGRDRCRNPDRGPGCE
jgi:Ca2+-binding RTX toxin-like protein